jgi:hypothetical protein
MFDRDGAEYMLRMLATLLEGVRHHWLHPFVVLPRPRPPREWLRSAHRRRDH